jgi:transcriptional regulator with XRE-family HTH domain
MKTAHTLTFGDVPRRCRAAAGLTQEELAEKAALSAKGIGDLERGARQHPRRETMHLLADVLRLAERDRAVLETAGRRRGSDSAATIAAAGPESRRAQPADVPTRLTSRLPFLAAR